MIALSGARDGDVGHALLQGNASGAAKAAREWAARVPRPLLPRSAARRARPTTTRWSPPPSRSPASSRCRSSRRIRCSSCARDGFPRARGARVHRRGPRARRSAPAAALHARAVFRHAGRDGGEVRRPARGAREQRRDRAALQPDDPARQELPAAISRRRRASRSTITCARRRPRASSAGSPRCIPMPPCATRERPEYAERLDVRDEDHRADGLRRLLPDRRRLHQLGEARTACRSGPAAAPARARSSRIRSASPTSIRCATCCCSSASSIPSACRCPTSTSTSARTAATASSTTCKQEVRRRVGVADRHVRHAGGASAAVRDVGRVLDLPYSVRRRHRQADSVPAGQDRHAEAAQGRARRRT